jgi:hypothetical protein
MLYNFLGYSIELILKRFKEARQYFHWSPILWIPDEVEFTLMLQNLNLHSIGPFLHGDTSHQSFSTTKSQAKSKNPQKHPLEPS